MRYIAYEGSGARGSLARKDHVNIKPQSTSAFERHEVPTSDFVLQLPSRVTPLSISLHPSPITTPQLPSNAHLFPKCMPSDSQNQTSKTRFAVCLAVTSHIKPTSPMCMFPHPMKKQEGQATNQRYGAKDNSESRCQPSIQKIPIHEICACSGAENLWDLETPSTESNSDQIEIDTVRLLPFHAEPNSLTSEPKEPVTQRSSTYAKTSTSNTENLGAMNPFRVHDPDHDTYAHA